MGKLSLERPAGEADDPAFAALRAAEGIGRPLANKDFIDGLDAFSVAPCPAGSGAEKGGWGGATAGVVLTSPGWGMVDLSPYSIKTR